MPRLVRAGLIALVFFFIPLHAAFAHGGGAIALSAKQVMPSGHLTITGEKFGHGSSLRLELRGTLKTFNLGRVPTDSAGQFTQEISLPVEAGPGQYTIAAVASDGDVAAQADLMVAQTTEGTSPAEHPGMHDMPGMAGMGGPHASAEKMDIPRTVTTAGLVVIAAIVLLSALAGMLLLRGTAGATRGE